jgi:hypothetical protein
MKATPIQAPIGLFELWNKVKQDYIIFTRRGKPFAYLFSAERYDQEDLNTMMDPEFWKMIRERRRSDYGIPLEDIEAEITARERSGRRRRRSKPAVRSARNGRPRK